MTLTKADLAKHLEESVGVPSRDSKELVDQFFKVMAEFLEKGVQVKLSGFGNFMLYNKRERPGRNPRTGEEVPVSARRVVTFHGGQKLKARVEQFAGKAIANNNDNSES